MKKRVTYCEMPFIKNKKTNSLNITRLFKHRGDFTWQEVKVEEYKDETTDWSRVIRCVLIGRHNESTKFHVRYFEVAPGGYTSFEKHKHEHVVIGIRGKGIAICGKKKFELDFLDVLYISPDTPHKLRNPFNEPFGFLCIVNAKRDRPKTLTPPHSSSW